MTLQVLIELTLRELHRPTDAITTDQWCDRLTRYANEAITDITASFRPWRRDVLDLLGGHVDLCCLPLTCQKVISLERDGKRLPFYYGSSTGELLVKNVPDGDVTITYRYIPPELVALDDQPLLPEFLHPLIVTYMVARERIQLDSTAQSGSKLNLSVYETLKRRFRICMDEPDTNDIYNCY